MAGRRVTRISVVILHLALSRAAVVSTSRPIFATAANNFANIRIVAISGVTNTQRRLPLLSRRLLTENVSQVLSLFIVSLI